VRQIASLAGTPTLQQETLGKHASVHSTLHFVNPSFLLGVTSVAGSGACARSSSTRPIRASLVPAVSRLSVRIFPCRSACPRSYIFSARASEPVGQHT